MNSVAIMTVATRMIVLQVENVAGCLALLP
jgi:hypothetical protein